MSLNALLRLLNNLPAIILLEKKVNLIIGGLRTVLPLSDDNSLFGPILPHWSILPDVLYEVDDDVKSDLNTKYIEKFDILYEDILNEKFTWECTNDLPDKAAASGITAKRKASIAIDGGNKRQNVDGVTGSVMDGASSANGTLAGRGLGALSSTSTSSKRDTFRQRKPNTSRPPSMHVDDYVARERGNEISTSVSVNMNQRSALGGGRPPSIHVDEA